MSDIDLDAHFRENVKDLMDRATDPDATVDEAKHAMGLLQSLSNVKMPPPPRPEPTPPTRWAKFRCGAAAALDNETTRALIKAGGAFAGVGLVVWSTIHRDHVLERQSMQQANQRPS